MNYASIRERDSKGKFVKGSVPSNFIPQTRYEIRKRWKAKNRVKVNQLQKLRTYREKNALGTHTLKDIEEIKSIFNYKCAYCREASAETIDHVCPLSKGGTNDPSNLVPSCLSCNSSKGNKLIWQWNFWWYYEHSRINEYGS